MLSRGRLRHSILHHHHRIILLLRHLTFMRRLIIKWRISELLKLRILFLVMRLLQVLPRLIHHRSSSIRLLFIWPLILVETWLSLHCFVHYARFVHWEAHRLAVVQRLLLYLVWVGGAP
jgi:hypothetical protein